MKRIISKRFLSLALAIIMVAALIPSTAFAAVGDVLTFRYDASNANITEYNNKNLFWPLDATSKTDEKTTVYIDDSSTYTLTYSRLNQIKYTTGSDTYYMYELKPGGTNKSWPTTYSGGVIFNVKVPKGTYKIKQASYNYWLYGGDVAIYIDGQYAGMQYNTEYDSAAESSDCTKVITELNTLSLNSDEKDFVKIEFRPIKLYYNGARSLRIYPVETVFEAVSSVSISDIECKTPSREIADKEKIELDEGTTTETITAKVKMIDDTYRGFFTYDSTGTADEMNKVTVKSSDESIVSVNDATTKDTDTTFSLTALKPGTATITVTAKVEGVEDKVETFTVNVPGAEPEEPETVSGNVSFGAYSDVENSVTVTINGTTSENEIESIAIGSTVKAVADTTNPNYKFLGWKRGSAERGVWLTDDATVEFPIMTHTFLTAVYEPVADEETTVNVEFYNYKGQYLDTAENVENKAFSEIVKPAASLTGYSSPFWTLDGVNAIADNAIFTKLTRVVANYRNKDSFIVTIGDGITGATTDEYDYDTELNLSAASAGTWYVNDNPVAYGASYKHCVWDEASITFDAGENTSPIISLDDIAKTNGARMISYDANGKEIVEVGILFGENAVVTSFSSKAASKATGNVQGQFTAMPNGTETTARGYLIYSDGTEYKVIYSK